MDMNAVKCSRRTQSLLFYLILDRQVCHAITHARTRKKNKKENE